MTSIGVTGHRFLTRVDQLEAPIERGLTRILACRPDPSPVLLSGLAEGADRLVARIALDRFGARLHAVLPLEPHEYLKDFDSQASRDEFDTLLARASKTDVVSLDPGASRTDAYFAAGMQMLDRADALIALWDGADTQAHGGTWHIVGIARSRALPLAWIHAENHRPDKPDHPHVAEPGTLTLERLPQK